MMETLLKAEEVLYTITNNRDFLESCSSNQKAVRTNFHLLNLFYV